MARQVELLVQLEVLAELAHQLLIERQTPEIIRQACGKLLTEVVSKVMGLRISGSCPLAFGMIGRVRPTSYFG